MDALLVMVQREVGERMAAGPGDAAYGAVSVRVAYFARAALAGRVPASVFVPRPRVESVLVRIDRRAVAGGRPGRGVLRAAGRGGQGRVRAAPQDAAPLARRRGRRPRRSSGPACDPRPGPRSSTSTAWGRLAAPVTRVMAPAKLTVSLHVTGVRPDGYHELDAEMVTLDLADELELDEGGAGITVAAAPGHEGRRTAAPRGEPGRPRAGGRGPAGRRRCT